MNCGYCHTCGTPLRTVLDGEEWCPRCKSYRRYYSHGFAASVGELGPCPPPPPVVQDDPQDLISKD